MHGERTHLRARFDAPLRDHLPQPPLQQPPLPSPFVLSVLSVPPVPSPSALQNQQFDPRETRPNKAKQTKTHLNKAFAPPGGGLPAFPFLLRGKERWIRWQNQARKSDSGKPMQAKKCHARYHFSSLALGTSPLFVPLRPCSKTCKNQGNPTDIVPSRTKFFCPVFNVCFHGKTVLREIPCFMSKPVPRQWGKAFDTLSEPVFAGKVGSYLTLTLSVFSRKVSVPFLRELLKARGFN